MKPTAIVLDDNRDVLDMTASFLKAEGVKVIAKDEVGESARQHLWEYRPDLVVMDILVPGPGGLDLLDVVRRDRLATRTILVTGHRREAWLEQALELGADAYLLKPHIPELITAVKAVLAGQRFLCPWATGFLAREYVRLRDAERTKDLLTDREVEILRHRMNGKTLKEIANEIQRSPKTVEKHLTSLKKKVGAGNETALAAFAMKAGLVPRS